MSEYFLPSDVDLSTNLGGTFGWMEFEMIAKRLVEYLASDEQDVPHWLRDESLRERDDGWRKPFYASRREPDNQNLFAMFCCAGWVENSWFPKALRVTDGFIDRLRQKAPRRLK